MSRPTQGGTAEPVSRDKTLRRERGRGYFQFPCSADHHEQDWQPYPVYPSLAKCDEHNTYYIIPKQRHRHTWDNLYITHIYVVLGLGSSSSITVGNTSCLSVNTDIYYIATVDIVRRQTEVVPYIQGNT